MLQNFVMTCLGPSLNPRGLRKIKQLLAAEHINRLKIKTLSTENPECIEIAVTSNTIFDLDALTKKLLRHTTPLGIDIIIQEDTPKRRDKRLIVMDMDSTLIQVEVIDELAKEANIGDKVSSITRRAMNGELSFKASLRERVGLLKKLPVEVLETVYNRIPFTLGAEQLLSVLQKLGCKTALLSGGFDYFTSRVKTTLQLDYAYSNPLVVKDGLLTGEVIGEIVDGEKKAALTQEIAKKENISLDQVIAIGDGANDLPMIHLAGLGIAFNAKPAVRSAARHCINQKSLLTVLYLLGFSKDDIEKLSS